jgi:hypothetical protein
VTSIRRLAVAALLTGAVLALTACDPRQAGAAAVVGKTRVTETQVNHDATQVIDLLTKSGAALPSTADLLRAQVEYRVDDVLVQVAAARNGITVTQGQIESLINQSGGRAALSAQLLQEQGVWLPPSRLNALAESFLIQQALGHQLAPTGDAAAQSTAVSTYISKLAKDLGVAISPRYGAWNPSTLRVGAAPNDLSRPATAASPTATG